MIKADQIKLEILSYFRFKRGWITVDEFQGADIIADTGKEIIEVEIKVSRYDLTKNEPKKQFKHHSLHHTSRYQKLTPNRFFFCTPEKLQQTTLETIEILNPDYGLITFYENTPNYLLTTKQAKRLHHCYDDSLRYKIALRTSSKLITLLQERKYHEKIHL